MRAAEGGPHERGGRHVSGAERVVEEEELETASLQLMRRAQDPERAADFYQLTVERVPASRVVRIPCLPVTTVSALEPGAARTVAQTVLRRTGIAPEVIAAAFLALDSGPGPSGSAMRGAAVLHSQTGKRLDPDCRRGVRVTHLDFCPQGRAAIQTALRVAGLEHFRTLEALTVATKVSWAGMDGEICWSDDRDYEAGYVATREAGYVRFPRFKPAGAAGGRIFFASDAHEMDGWLTQLQNVCVLIKPPVIVRGPVPPDAFLRELDGTIDQRPDRSSS